MASVGVRLDTSVRPLYTGLTDDVRTTGPRDGRSAAELGNRGERGQQLVVAELARAGPHAWTVRILSAPRWAGMGYGGRDAGAGSP